VFARIAGGVGINHLSASKFSQIVIPLAPQAEQQEVVDEIERLLSVADETAKTTEHELQRAERLRQSILKRAFEGKLVPQDPGDEPASVLLQRIRAEKKRGNAAAGTRPVVAPEADDEAAAPGRQWTFDL
jgi:type I restriction enzyme S subunit